MKILKIFKELDKKFQKRTMVLITLMFFAGFLEMIGISLILPLLSLLTGTLDSQSNFLNYLDSFYKLIDLERDQLIMLFIFTLSLLYVLKNLYLGFIYYLQTKFIRDFQIKLGKKLLNAYLSMPINNLSNKNSSIYIRNLSNDLVFLANSLTCYATLFLEGFIIILIILMLLFTMPYFTLIIIFVFTFITVLYVYLSNKKIKVWGENRQFHESEKIKNLKQSIEFIREIKIYNISDFFLEKFNNSNFNFSQSMFKHHFLQSLVKLWLETLTVFLIVVLLFFIISFASPIESIPIIGLFAGATFKLLPSLNRIINGLNLLKFVKPIENVFLKDLISYNLNFKSKKEFKKFDFKNEIVFENVSFSYSDDKIIIKDLNMRIPKGSTVGIFGSSGKGKSTFFDLLAGIQIPNKGKIYIDGKDLSQNITEWQNILGYTHQDTIILDDTIKNNITIGNEKNIDTQDLEESIQISELSKFISDTKKGVETHISEQGSNISGGQKQRIGIARTIFKKPEVLIFDEATNSLDKTTGNKILLNIKKKFSSKTIFLISHDLSLKDYCDQIINLE
jgi:ABC-type multidrug transport system fused ATPase/permease subunit